MDYQKHYEQLIAKHGSQDKPEGYSERHHIVPKSMGGSNDDDNLVYLSAKAHFVAHHLLWRWHRNSSMAYAFHMMCVGQQKLFYKPSASAYHEAKSAMAEEVRKRMSGRVVSKVTRDKLSAANSGKNRNLPVSEATRKKLSKARSGRKNHKAKLANVYCVVTGNLVASGVLLGSWAKSNGFTQSALSMTALADRSKPSSRSNKLHHKGVYARYI